MSPTGYWLRMTLPFSAILAAALGSAAVSPGGRTLAAVAVAALSATMALGALHARRLVGLLEQVSALADRVAAGEYGVRVEAAGVSEVAAVADSVNRMAARLAREGHARASFIGKVSHELRTPVTVIKGYAYTLRRTDTTPAVPPSSMSSTASANGSPTWSRICLSCRDAQAGELRISAETFRFATASRTWSSGCGDRPDARRRASMFAGRATGRW